MSKKVLIVDDEPNILMSVEFLMQRGGYEVATAADGQEAMDLLGEFRPDLMILDVMMPRKNGFEVCAEVRADPGTIVPFQRNDWVVDPTALDDHVSAKLTEKGAMPANIHRI